MRFLFALFIIVPLVEMTLLIQVGTIIGVLPTIGLVVLTAFIGINLLRMQGFETWRRLNQRLAVGQIPGQELVEAAMLLVGGALLLTPGFVTDTIGFCCLIPFSRRPIARWLIRRGIVTMIRPGTFQAGGTEGHFHERDSRSRTIEGEFEPHDRDK